MSTPSVQEIFWFDCGRAYQFGVFMGMAGKDILSEKSFPIICRAIIKRYTGQAEVIKELFQAYSEGYTKGTTWCKETGRILNFKNFDGEVA
jgi:hypothetical protein